MDKKVKQIIANLRNGQLTHMYTKIDQLLPSCSIHDQRALLFETMVSLKNTTVFIRFHHYFDLYNETLIVTPLTHTEKWQWAYLQVEVAFYNLRLDETIERADQLLQRLHKLPLQEERAVIQGSLIHFKVLSCYLMDRFEEGVKFYNSLSTEILTIIEKQSPLLILQLHGHMAVNYIQLRQWHTAEQMILSLLTIVDTFTNDFKPTLLIRLHIIQHIIHDEVLDLQFVHEQFKEIQNLPRFIVGYVLKDVATLSSVLRNQELDALLHYWTENYKPLSLY